MTDVGTALVLRNS